MVSAKESLANTIMSYDQVAGKTARGRPTRQWFDDVEELTRLNTNEIWSEPDQTYPGESMLFALPIPSDGMNSVHVIQYSKEASVCGML